MPLPGIVPFIGPIASGISSFLNYGEQTRANKEAADLSRYNTDQTIKYQKEAADLAWNRNIAQWHAANKYESPSEQIGRLKQAGLNPMLVYGSGSPAGGSAPSPKMDTPNYQVQYQARAASQMDPTLGAALSNTASVMADLSIKKAQVNNIEANTRSTNLGSALQIMEGLGKALDFMRGRRSSEADTRTKEATAGISEQELRNTAIKNFLENQRLAWDSIKASREHYQSNSLFPYQMEVQKGSVQEQKQRITQMQAQTGGIRASTEKTKAETLAIPLLQSKIKQDIKNEQVREKLLKTEYLQKAWDLFISANQGKYAGVTGPLELFTRGATIGTNVEGDKIWKEFATWINSQK